MKTVKGLIVDLSSKNLNENSVYKLLCKWNELSVARAKDLLTMTGQFLKLVTFNKNVFGSNYGEAIQSILSNE